MESDYAKVRTIDGKTHNATELQFYRGEDGRLKLNFRAAGGGWTEANIDEVSVKLPAGP